jgi:hypothetical protein
MKPSPRSRSSARAPLASFALAALFLALASAGCENKHIGRPCDLNAHDDGGATSGTATTATVNPEALECPSRICLKPGNQQNSPTGPLCTAECESDDDCSDGETTGTASDNTHCHKGFVCMVPVTIGDLCCRKLCVCRDFVAVPPGGFKTPPECVSGTPGITCKNVPH